MHNIKSPASSLGSSALDRFNRDRVRSRSRTAGAVGALLALVVSTVGVAGASTMGHPRAHALDSRSPNVHLLLSSGARAHRPRRTTRSKTAALPPIVQPSAREHLTILKIGDSLGEELGFGLRDRLGANRNVTIYQEAVGDTGLARPDFYNWPLHLRQFLAAYHPRVVIIMLGGDDGQGFSVAGHVVSFGSALWHTIYSQRVASMMSESVSAGAHVVWVGLPIMSSSSFSWEMAQMNAIYAAQALLHPGVMFVPTWSLFADAKGSYSAYLPGPTGTSVLMRNPDGVHLSGAGDDRLAGAVVDEMNATWRIHL